MAETTWSDVAKKHPEIIQRYVQENGPLPDGPVTKESWTPFWNWMNPPAP